MQLKELGIEQSASPGRKEAAAQEEAARKEAARRAEAARKEAARRAEEARKEAARRAEAARKEAVEMAYQTARQDAKDAAIALLGGLGGGIILASIIHYLLSPPGRQSYELYIMVTGGLLDFTSDGMYVPT